MASNDLTAMLEQPIWRVVIAGRTYFSQAQTGDDAVSLVQTNFPSAASVEIVQQVIRHTPVIGPRP